MRDCALSRFLGVVDTVYGRVTQALNMMLFVTVFTHHWHDLCFIESCMEDHLFRSVGTATMIHHVILVRHSVDTSVEAFHPMFSSFTAM